MVAARRLRKSMLKDMPNINFNEIDSISNKKNKHKDSFSNDEMLIKDNLGTFDDENKKGNKIRIKLLLKIFFSVIIVFSCLIINIFFKNDILKYKYISIIVNEYNKDYTKVGCIEKFEDIVNNVYLKSKYIIPDSIASKIRENYISNVKPYIAEFEVIDSLKKLFVKSETINNNLEKNELNIEENNSIGDNEPVLQTLSVPDTDIETIKMYNNISKILEKNIEIKQPVSGTITSRYGTREQIFEELSNYHTGIDIANKLGTEIYSATEGVVKKVEENNKYYGNNIEIEKENVIFKYAHLKGFNVKEGDSVTCDSVIGYMGSTGMSTGSHLHFEIRINGCTVDPEQILKFK